MTLVVIRADASVAIGSGHVMRCLSLADALRALNVEIVFVCRELAGSLCDLIERRGFEVLRLSGEACGPDADAAQMVAIAGKLAKIDHVIVDHYGLDEGWETYVRHLGGRIMAIDDMANRRHDCDLLLDQNIPDGTSAGYPRLVPEHCHMLLGPRYALLSSEFTKERARLRARDGELGRILLFFGGSDPTNDTGKALTGIMQLDLSDLLVDVVVGIANPNRREVQQLCESYANISYHCQVDNMAELMAAADLSLGAGGSASWERCCLHLPAIIAVQADNQELIAKSLAEVGAVRNLGRSAQLGSSDYATAVSQLTASDLRQMSHAAGTLTDGQGAWRTAVALVESA